MFGVGLVEGVALLVGVDETAAVVALEPRPVGVERLVGDLRPGPATALRGRPRRPAAHLGKRGSKLYSCLSSFRVAV